jgi:hypothetical protein
MSTILEEVLDDMHNIEYKELCRLTDELIESDKKLVEFSIFRDVSSDHDNWIVSAPDITSDKPIIDGEVVFISDYWRLIDHLTYNTESREIESRVYTNPTWKDIINAANEMLACTCQCSLFLEGLAPRGVANSVKRVEIEFGS